MSDQSHALRVRTFVNFLQGAEGHGALVSISTPVTEQNPCPSAEYAKKFRTTLRRLELAEFDKLAEHGFQVAARVEREFGFARSGAEIHWQLGDKTRGRTTYPQLVDRSPIVGGG